MSPTATFQADPIALRSAHGVADTVERLKALLARKGIQVFVHIDHAAEAAKIGLSLRPTQVVKERRARRDFPRVAHPCSTRG